jgi:hypothetical protein
MGLRYRLGYTVIPEIKQEWEKQLNLIKNLKVCRIPRWIGGDCQRIELIGFSDASINGFAAVVYARTLRNSERNVCLLAARGRVTPLKLKRKEKDQLLTIPKLELEGLLLLQLNSI